MTDKVRDRLKELAAYLEYEHAVESVDESLGHLQRATADCMVRSRALAQQATIYLFQSQDPPSLVEFLDASGAMSEDIRKREISHARIKVLELLAAFVKTYGGHVAVTRRHIVEITQRCQVIARGDWSNKVRSTALDVVINVLKYADARVTAEDIDPSGYVDKLFYDLKFSKATQTAKGTMLEVIGHVATVFPTYVEPKVQQLLPWIEDQLEKQFATNSPEMLLINGLLEALARLLVFDVGRYEDADGKAKRQQLYTYLHRILATTVDGQMSRYQVTKAALQFLTIHAELFREEIGANAYTWFSFMKFCMLSETKTVKANAFSASDSVISVIGKFLGSAEKDDQRKKTLNRLLKELLPVLVESNTTTTNVAFTLQAIGYLSTSVLLYLGENGFLKIEDRLRKFGENLLVLDERATAMRWSTFSSFLQCFAEFAQQPRTGSFDSGYIAFMEDMVLHVLNAYPQCLWKSKVTLYKSILLIVRAVQKQGEKQRLLGRIVNHLLLLTLSNITDMDDMVILYHPETGNAETKLVYEFEGLWIAILRGKKYAKYKSKDITTLKNQVTKMAKGEAESSNTTERRCILNALLHALSEIIDNLDLSYQYDLQEARAGASSGGYKPNVPRDHSIMLNLTEFLERLVPRLEPSQLRFWIPSTMMGMFEKSRQLPLVSAFYRIIRVLAVTADSLKLFEKGREAADDSADSETLRSYYASFVNRIVHNLRFYKDELLVATSGCVLATPLPLLQVEEFAEAVAPALLVGRSFFPAADMAITGLEKWQEAEPARLATVFDRIVPCLAVYLDRNEAGADEEVSMAGAYKEKDAVITEASNDSDWLKLQRRVMTFLGKAGGQASLLLSRSGDATDGMSRRGFSANVLGISLSLGDLSVDVTLDKLLSHLGSLACESTDRRVKAAACEVYHALVCYLCGMTATHPHTSGSTSEYHNVWKTVLPVIISLATDAEKICRSLFEPLLFQVTRWLCHGSETFPHEFGALLDELIDGLSHETSTAIREMSGKCLSTCLTSAVESGGVDSTQGLAKTETVLQRLFSLCRHPGPAQRTGAATAISYFLRTLREEDVGVVQAFGLRCLKNFLFSLKLCGRDARVGKTDVQILEDMITKAILKLQRAVVRYPTAFTKSKKVPPANCDEGDVQYEEGDDLASFTQWLFGQSASRETVYRTTCRQLFLSFAPIVTGSNAKAWIEAYGIKADANSGNDPVHIVLAPLDHLAVITHTNDHTNWNLQVAIDWLDQLTASLECYAWCSNILGGSGKKLLCPPSGASSKRKLSELSHSKEDSDTQLVIVWAIHKFLQHFDSLSDLQEETHNLLDLSLRSALRRCLLTTAASICELVSLTLASSSDTVASEILTVGDTSSQQQLSRMMVQAIGLGVAGSAKGDHQADGTLEKIKQACRLVVEKNVGLAQQLQGSVVDCVANVRVLITSTSRENEPTGLLLSLRTMNELLACGLLANSTEPDLVEHLVGVAAESLNSTLVSPTHRSLAIEAMKVACCLGWDVRAMFDDQTVAQRLSAIYRDVLRFFPNERIWDRVVTVLMANESEDYAPRLEALVELLSLVVSMKSFAPRSTTMDMFCRTYAPHFRKLLAAIKDKLSTNREQMNRLLLEVLDKSIPVFNAGSKSVSATLSQELFPDIRAVAIALLRRRDASHFVKGDCLSLLAAVGPAAVTSDDKMIQEALSGFVIDEFPISSVDVKRGSRDYDIFRMLLGKLLSIVEAYRRADYLNNISFALKEGDRHLFWDDIRASLGRLATAVTSRDAQGAATDNSSDRNDFLVDVSDLLLDSSGDQNVRRSLLDELAIPILELQDASHLSKFYMASTTRTSTATLISKLATIVANSGDIATPSAFLTVAVAFSLVEVLYRLVDPELVRGEINNAFLGHANGKGREFTMLVCKCASKFVTKSYDGALTDTTRFACWKAYNCLLTAVSRTQKQEKFFDQILFQDSLWANIVDVAREYELRTETKQFDRVPLSRFSATTLRQQQQQQDGRSIRTAGSRTSNREPSPSLRFFTGSSLSQASPSMGDSQQLLISADLAAQEAVYAGIEIELDAINDHPCMVPLLRVLTQMKADFGDGWSASAMPVWMKKIFEVAANPTSELNIRLFIVKVVLDVPEVFERYKSMWADKMMDALLEATVSSSSGKAAEFHYLLRDLCALLVDEWNEVDAATMSTTASRFVNELIELAPNEDYNLIMQDNLVLIAQLIQQWKTHLRIDTSIVSKLLLFHDENPRREAADRYVALQVISAMLSADMFQALSSAYTMADGAQSLEDGIVQAMDHKRPSIYNVAAEVSGLLLAAQGSSAPSSQSFRTKLLDQITKYYNEEDFGRFLALLRSVSLYDGSVLDAAMLHRLSFVLPRVVAIEAWSMNAAECLVHAANHVDDKKILFTHCQSVLPRFLSHRNAVVQRHAVHLVEALLPGLDDDAIERLVATEKSGGHDLFRYSRSQQDPSVRRVFINLAMKLYQRNMASSSTELIREQLLRGLADNDADIRRLVRDFWKASLTAASCSERLSALFQQFFAAGVADLWVLYSTNLLLDMNATSDAYEATLFKSSLSECEFHDASIDAAWESKDQTMTPLFSVETDKFSAFAMLARRSSQGSLSSQGFTIGTSASQLDGTLPSQSQLISYTLASQEFVGSSSLSQGSFGFSQGESSGRKRRQQRRFTKRSATNGAAASQSDSDPKAAGGKYSRPSSDKKFFQDRYAMLKKNEEAMLNRQRMARAQQVVMRRKYRVGDYPDIQIKLRDILDPLMALCDMHAPTSAIVLADVIAAILTSKTVLQDATSLQTLGSHMDRALLDGRHSLIFVGAVHLAYFASLMKDTSLVKSIGISYQTIGTSSLASSSNLSGELILEEYLNLEVPHSRDEAAECWDQLYKILATNQKSNLLVALASRCCTIDESKVALQAQLAGDLPGAIASYRKAESLLQAEFEMQPDDALLGARFELHRCAWERYGCLEKLNHWDKLHRELLGGPASDSFDSIWQEPSPYMEQGIGHCLRALLGPLGSEPELNDGESEAAQQLQAFLKNAEQETQRWDVVMARFGVEASLASIALGQLGRARVQVEQLYGLILKRWGATSKIARLSRLEILQNLSSTVEIDDALMLANNLQLTSGKVPLLKTELETFTNRWSHVLPSLGEGSMGSWSQFYMVQQVLGSFIQRTGKREGALSSTQIVSIHHDLSQLMLRYAGAGVQNDILALASKYLKDYRELCNTHNLPKVSVLMVDVYVSHVLKLAERQAHKSTREHRDRLAPDALSAITRYYQSSAKMFDNSDILELMETLPLADRIAMGTLEAKTFGTASQFYMQADLDAATTEEFFTRAFDTFQRSSRAIPAPATNEPTDSPTPDEFARCRTTFIEFLVDVLFSSNAADWTRFVDRRTLVVALMDNVVGGMATGNQECANYFPQLCELLPAFPDIVADFEKRVLTQVPIWTCLRWSSQLLALVGGAIGPTIVKILEKMAAEYPVALFYDFKLTYGDLQAKAGTAKVDLSRLQLLLSNPVMESFVDALRLIHHPELRLKEGLRELAKLLEEGKTAAAKAKVAHIWQDCFATEHLRLGGKIGQYNRDWARRAKRDVEKIMGRGGANVSAKTVLAAREWIGNNFSVVPGKYGMTKDMKARLADFAEWLDEFDHSRLRLELPGQYTTRWGKPDPSNHVHILSIHSTLGVLVSKQLPKQITLHCSDQNNYTFLVKGGEDLRLDQRIEQLFDVMNQILSSDARCRDRNLRTKTYKVIPMTTEIGMIEWLHNTSTLKGIIERQLQQDPRCQHLQSNKRVKLQLFNTVPAKQYETFLMKQRGSSFAAKVAAPSRHDVTSNFDAVQDLIPADLLRRQLIALGADFEDFISIRDEFASSLAVFNACSYILGIGDRHLDNFLMDHATGRVIGIDFGVSFGAGASVLPVPELIPFRFTRQMESVLLPYDSANLVIQDMQAVFEALRDKKQVVESVMNVFLHEPLLDWQQSTTIHQSEMLFKEASSSLSDEVTQVVDDDVVMMEDASTSSAGSSAESGPRKRAKRQSNSVSSASSSASASSTRRTASSSSSAAPTTAWLPDVKIAIARRKLDGLSPRVLLKEELAQNPHLGKQLALFQALIDTAVVNGAQPSSATPMSSLAQAQELVALATAPDLLGRTYHGWMPWL